MRCVLLLNSVGDDNWNGEVEVGMKKLVVQSVFQVVGFWKKRSEPFYSGSFDSSRRSFRQLKALLRTNMSLLVTWTNRDSACACSDQLYCSLTWDQIHRSFSRPWRIEQSILWHVIIYSSLYYICVLFSFDASISGFFFF
jgi:hypothetical protein